MIHGQQFRHQKTFAQGSGPWGHSLERTFFVKNHIILAHAAAGAGAGAGGLALKNIPPRAPGAGSGREKTETWNLELGT